LRLAISTFIDREHNDWLKTRESNYQYQADLDGKDWIFRYDYARDPKNKYPHAHLQIRGALSHVDALPSEKKLERVHFPTSRIAIESVLQILIDDFGLEPNDPDWRQQIGITREPFLMAAHQV
jgi:hypothetical protein